ncbi:zinc finger MYM-type protein 1-like [Hydra vulgaris]|uniref:Zinc finger MYM-type protein 1-like n=1 Tax=Hydra vulgaris TaxID=6087 RepID=A0ABM4DCJ7_HYDVU
MDDSPKWFNKDEYWHNMTTISNLLVEDDYSFVGFNSLSKFKEQLFLIGKIDLAECLYEQIEELYNGIVDQFDLNPGEFTMWSGIINNCCLQQDRKLLKLMSLLNLNMKRKFESGASKRRKRQKIEEETKSLKSITSFLRPLENQANPTHGKSDIEISGTTSSEKSMLQQNKNPQIDTNVQDISNTTCVSESGITDLESLESNCENSLIHQSNSQQRETNLQAISNDNCISDSEISYSENLDQKCESDCSNISKLIVSDIGTVDKRNITQMQESFQTNFLIPNNIPRDSYNHAFPTRLRSKILPNGEICTRDCQHIYDPDNGNFLGIIELLSKYDPILSEHVKKVHESQLNKKRLQVHYLSTRIQNELIELCGSFVQTKIIEEIQNTKYFSIVVDATPDCSHKEQTTFIICYIKIDGSKFSIEERFLYFDDYSKKTGKEIAARILHVLTLLNIDFKLCTGQAYDNGPNMAGKYKGVQAVLLEENPNCMFASCGNHTLNLVGVDCAESCKEAILYFGIVQQMYNFFSSSPQRWKILKQHVPASLHGISKTRWSARIEAVKPVARHLNSLRTALKELQSLNLTVSAQSELQSIQKYLSKFECIVMSSLWMKLLTMIHQTNLIIEARNATLDVEMENIKNLMDSIQQIRKKWDVVLSESKLIAMNIDISPEFSTTRKLKTQFDSEQHYKINVFFVIIGSILAGLKRRFESQQQICSIFGFLWHFNKMSNEELLSATTNFQKKYHKEILSDISDEIIFLKQIYSTNFTSDCKPKELFQEILELGLSGVFPNISIALRIFISLPVSVASGERSFNVLKQVKNYHRSTMGQECLNGLAMLNINCDIARKLDFSTVVSAFAKAKARKAFLK